MSKRTIFCLLLLAISIPTLAAVSSHAGETTAIKPDEDITQKFPHLNQYLFRETDTKIRFGFGIAPIEILKRRVAVSLSILQIHYITPTIDWELLNGSYGSTISGEANTKVNSFAFRTVPKLRLTETFSLGPMIGYEYVRFPDVKARQYRGNYFTPEEPLSSRGLIYGGCASQIIKTKGNSLIRLNQLVYKQTYDVSKTSNQGWSYYYSDNALNLDPSPIAAGIVFALEVSFLY